MKKLAERNSYITASPTLAISAKAKALKEQGRPVISFGAGEPDFDTPDFIKDAAKKAIDSGFTKYTANSGIPDLKKAICQKLLTDNHLEYKPNQIIVSTGAKQCLFNAILAICDKGDEFIVIAPYWVTYVDQIKFAEGIPKIITTNYKNNFKINIQDLENVITPKTKALIINSPSNPTGVVYSKDELKQIADLVVKKDIYVISDEIYEKIIYEGEHVSIASFGSEIKKRTIVINGVSKSHSMTGWRIGYTAAEENIISAMDNIQSQSTSNANSIAQKATLAALGMGPEKIDEMVEHFKDRRDYIVSYLNNISGVTCYNPKGAFYAFPNISNFLGKSINNIKINSTMDFSNLLLEIANVAVVPGEAFGDNESIRLSYALSMDEIKEGVKRIKDFIQKIN
jgi:aspartate aminotransferase